MSEIVEGWQKIKTLVDGLESDVVKNATKGNNAAGVRVRKGLREVRKLAHALVRVSINNGKKTDETPADTTTENTPAV